MENSPKQCMVCCGCSLLCDDISLPDQPGSQIPSGLCDKGKCWFDELVLGTTHRIRGHGVSYADAIGLAKSLISRSRMPLILGLDGLCIASQQAAFRLADQLRAAISVSLVESGTGGLNALQRVGKVTATIGEVAQRSNLVLLWFSDPLTTHPRAWERFIRPESDSNRTVIVVDSQETESARRASQFLHLDRSQSGTALGVLRSLLSNCRIDKQRVLDQTGYALTRWRELLDMIVSSQYGAVLSGPVDESRPCDEFDTESEQLALLVRALNDKTRFVSVWMRDDLNASGAENILAWSSGFGESVNLNRGFPRSCFAEYSAHTMLVERSCDLILVASLGGVGKAWKNLSSAAREHFIATPKIVLNELGVGCEFEPEVEICIKRPGFSGTGDFCRLDEVAMALPMIRSVNGMPSAADVFELLS